MISKAYLRHLKSQKLNLNESTYEIDNLNLERTLLKEVYFEK